MKIFKLTLLVFLIAFTTTTYAQDASNDATWEETVEFVIKQVKLFEHTRTHIKTERFSKTTYYVNDDIFYRKTTWQDGSYSMSQGNLENLKKVNLRDSYIGLNFTPNSVLDTQDDDYSVRGDSMGIMLNSLLDKGKYKISFEWEKEDNQVQRLYRAFQHLAYLAGE